MEIVLALAGGLIGAVINQLATEVRERRKREIDSRATERHAVADYLGAVSEVQHHIQVLYSLIPGEVSTEEALSKADALHQSRMALLTAYGRTRLDVTTVPVRNAIDHTYHITKRVDAIIGEGSEDIPFPITQQMLGKANTDISNCCEDLLRVCEASIGPKKLSRRELKAAQAKPSLAPQLRPDEME